MDLKPSRVEIPMDVRELKRVQRSFGLLNREFARLLGVSLPTYKSWIHRRHVPLYMTYSIETLTLLSNRDFVRVKNRRGL